MKKGASKIALEFFKLKTVEENNKLIAEFMKLEKYGENEFLHEKLICNYRTMKYTESWDWLMPVIEKIERTNLDHIKEVQNTMLGKNHTATINLMNERCILWIAPNWTLANMFSTDSRLSNAYYCVVKFIEWYNENK